MFRIFSAISITALLISSCGYENLSTISKTAGHKPSSLQLKQNTVLHIDVDNMKSLNGQVCVSIYDESQDFPDENSENVFTQCLAANVAATDGFNIDLTPGRYAAALFHDENGNNEMDMKRILGIKVPKEPFGFSQNPKMKARAPRFDECVFEITTIPSVQKITLKKL